MPHKSKAHAARDSPPRSVEDQEEEELELNDPPSVDPYNVLKISETATADEIKSAYRKLALKHHPDKARPEDRESAHKAFQEIAFAYAILSDDRRRKRYDATGNTAESANIDDDDFNWVDFFREQRANVVSGDMIEQIKKEYQGSEEEKEDVLAAYEEGEGDMDAVFESVMCSEVLVDEERFRQIIDDAIDKGEVPAFDRYTKEGKKSRERRKTNAKKEAEEAREYARELGVEDKLFGKTDSSKKKKPKKSTDDGEHDALKALIQQRQQSRAQNFFDDLEAKYGGASTKKGKRKALEEPPEEAFQKNAKKGKKTAKA
ncbi:DnaJ like subfamily C member 9 [Capronia coronata CBS 617.96]|uniref:DnaJ like subfamily C member 9 n=1 Tax=Capronia coronata CBS 617.96 TaxID=1182541 RepID=W9YWS4_9EURO|nr:DnaJ like subfamily C member 9 [Capronia coronata CBS 617.96]EXJ93736.1 DnaJ like subfamily C member 9 [Capronia coronata CBS 617.96]